jgi:hypothetical protein
MPELLAGKKRAANADCMSVCVGTILNDAEASALG